MKVQRLVNIEFFVAIAIKLEFMTKISKLKLLYLIPNPGH